MSAASSGRVTSRVSLMARMISCTGSVKISRTWALVISMAAGQAVRQVASPHFHSALAVIGCGRADFQFNLLRHGLADKQVVVLF